MLLRTTAGVATSLSSDREPVPQPIARHPVTEFGTGVDDPQGVAALLDSHSPAAFLTVLSHAPMTTRTPRIDY